MSSHAVTTSLLTHTGWPVSDQVAALMDDRAKLWMRRCTDSKLATRPGRVTVVMMSVKAKTSKISLYCYTHWTLGEPRYIKLVTKKSFYSHLVSVLVDITSITMGAFIQKVWKIVGQIVF